VIGEDSVPQVNVGKTRLIVSLILSGAFNPKAYDKDDDENVIGLVSVRVLRVKLRGDTADEELMATAVILANPARVAATVRVLRSASCTALAVVTPVPTVT